MPCHKARPTETGVLTGIYFQKRSTALPDGCVNCSIPDSIVRFYNKLNPAVMKRIYFARHWHN
jgi:hypothetical protein